MALPRDRGTKSPRTSRLLTHLSRVTLRSLTKVSQASIPYEVMGPRDGGTALSPFLYARDQTGLRRGDDE